MARMRGGSARRAAARTQLQSAHSSRQPRRLVLFFDLDNTLHDASHAIFGEIDARMTDFVERHLGVARDEADRLRLLYWRRYGATLLGLVRQHGIAPAQFLHEAHDFDVAALVRAERGLTRLFARLPGRVVLVTNAPQSYASRVLRALAVHRRLRTRYAIEQMRVHGAFRPKPSRALLRVMLARERIGGRAAVLIEDSPGNLKAARALGMHTVLMRGHGTALATRGVAARRRPHYVGLLIRSIHELPRGLARLRH
jgi:putative hydrolase of the HAD superfamily